MSADGGHLANPKQRAQTKGKIQTTFSNFLKSSLKFQKAVAVKE
jgi:hypothetical protein